MAKCECITWQGKPFQDHIIPNATNTNQRTQCPNDKYTCGSCGELYRTGL